METDIYKIEKGQENRRQLVFKKINIRKTLSKRNRRSIVLEIQY